MSTSRKRSRPTRIPPDIFRASRLLQLRHPFESNFFKYFARLQQLGPQKAYLYQLRRLPIAGAQLTFGEYDEGNGKRRKPKAIAVEIEEVKDFDGNGAPLEDVSSSEEEPHTRAPLAEGGDFRSAECVELLKQADIVVTNPPFSLFRDYVAATRGTRKKFLIIATSRRSPTRRSFRWSKAQAMDGGHHPRGDRSSAFQTTIR